MITNIVFMITNITVYDYHLYCSWFPILLFIITNITVYDYQYY